MMEMVKIKNLAAKSLAIGIIRRVVSTLAILFLIVSITSPFCSAMSFGSSDISAGALLWSYRSDFYHSSGRKGIGPIQYLFSDYWFSFLNHVYPIYPKLTWMIMLMFILQVLTLVFGIISVMSNRRILSLAPVCLSVTVLALMIYTINALLGTDQFGNYEQGYYFIYFPIVLFLFAFVLNKVTKNLPKYKTTDLPRGDAK